MSLSLENTGQTAGERQPQNVCVYKVLVIFYVEKDFNNVPQMF